MNEIEVLKSRLRWIEYATRLATRVGIYVANYNAYLDCRLRAGSTVPPEEDVHFWDELNLVVEPGLEIVSSAGSTTGASPVTVN